MIHIAKDYYLGADAYNLILYRARTTKEGPLTKPENVGKVRLSEVGYYNTLDDAINAIFKTVFAEYTEGWDEEKYIEIETIISGIEYATIMKTEHSASVERRLEGALGSILLLLGVPAETREKKISKVLAMDYLSIGRKVYEDFKQYVTETNENALDEILQNTKIRTWK